MKLGLVLLLAGTLVAFAETEEKMNKRFTAQAGGKLVVNVDFGSIDVTTNNGAEVVIDVVRKISRGSKADEEAFLRDRPVTFTQEDGTVTVESRAKADAKRSWFGRQRTEGKYTITVPSQFNLQLHTAGGPIAVSDITGEVKAHTSGGGLKFTRLHGPVDGHTSGGSVQIGDSDGDLKVKTSGGNISAAGGSGTLVGHTSGGDVAVKDFKGPAEVQTSGGGISIDNVSGKVRGSTSGGSVSARFASKPSEEIKLEASGGGVTVRLPENSTFDLDASTSGGSVTSDLPVSTAEKPNRSRLKGTVNGGGKPVVLRSGGGSIHVKKL